MRSPGENRGFSFCYNSFRGMPTISSFYGILIRMFYNDHGPPHFHARYGEFEATIFRVSNAR